MQTLKRLSSCMAIAFGFVASAAMGASVSQSAWATQVDSVQEGNIQATVVYSFAALDLDQDGGLVRSEVPLDMVDLRMDFRRADYDGNGRLSAVECAMYGDGKVPAYTGPEHAWNVVLDTPERRDTIIADR